jgi:hypothetical protein
VPVQAEEYACAQVIDNSPFVVLSQLYTDCMIFYGKSTKSRLLKATEQRSAIVQTTPSTVAISAPPPMVGTGLMIFSNAEASQSTRQVLQYLEILKDAKAEREGNQCSFTTSGYLLLLLTPSCLFL